MFLCHLFMHFIVKNLSPCTKRKKKLNFSFMIREKHKKIFLDNQRAGPDTNLFITKSKICYRSKLKFNLIGILKLIVGKNTADSHANDDQKSNFCQGLEVCPFFWISASASEFSSFELRLWVRLFNFQALRFDLSFGFSIFFSFRFNFQALIFSHYTTRYFINRHANVKLLSICSDFKSHLSSNNTTLEYIFRTNFCNHRFSIIIHI